MARGWESKSVESQQDEARREADLRRTRGREEAPEVRERRHALELARARAEADLLAACAPAYREMLRQKIEAIDAQLRALRST
jgi:hypothetical protein